MVTIWSTFGHYTATQYAGSSQVPIVSFHPLSVFLTLFPVKCSTNTPIESDQGKCKPKPHIYKPLLDKRNMELAVCTWISREKNVKVLFAAEKIWSVHVALATRAGGLNDDGLSLGPEVNLYFGSGHVSKIQ